MQFQPKSDKEIEEMNLWPVGEYGFEILDEVTIGSKFYETKDTRSKKEKEMIQLVVKVYNAEGGFKILMDYLLEDMPAKLRHAAAACGLLDKYETGTLLANDFRGKSGNLKLVIQKGKEKEDSPGDFYPDRNAIKDYVTSGDVNTFAPPPGHPAAGGFIDDTIPFDRIKTLA
jgi:hypothetical protein